MARVLDQLSVTSWLPSVFLVGNAAVLLAMQGKDQLNLAWTIQNLVDLQWGAVIVLLFAVIIFAMVIQAFEFESLRFWEGYLRSARLQRWARRRITAYQAKRDRWDEQVAELQAAAFDDARRRALDGEATSMVQVAMWNAMEKVVHGRGLDDGEELVADQAAAELDWPTHADPAALHAWDIATLKLAEYPRPHRIPPTRLGNVMRAAEDKVQLLPGEDLEGFMIRHMDELPTTIVAEHAAHRRRLEMYCGLMFVLASLSALSVFCLWGHSGDLIWRAIVPTVYAIAVWISYKAAIASALGFGQALKEASSWVQQRRKLGAPTNASA